MQQRVAIVTGAGSGIGRAIAEHLARASDYRVVVVDRNERGRAVADSLGGQFIQVDVSDSANCSRVVDETVASHGTVHVPVNNAGFQHVAPLDEFPDDVWDTRRSR